MAYWCLYYHAVWTTKYRAPLITADIEPLVHNLVGSKFQAEGARVYALNGMEDHIHAVIAVPPALSLALLIKAVKGSTSHFLHHEQGITFKWQPGYGIFTVSPRGLRAAMEYVKRQKEHHRAGTLIRALEYVTEDDRGPTQPELKFESPEGTSGPPGGP